MDAKLQLLKAKLRIKREMKYVQKNAVKALEEYKNHNAYNSWVSMYEAYKISLDILEGKEI